MSVEWSVSRLRMERINIRTDAENGLQSLRRMAQMDVEEKRKERML